MKTMATATIDVTNSGTSTDSSAGTAAAALSGTQKEWEKKSQISRELQVEHERIVMKKVFCTL